MVCGTADCLAVVRVAGVAAHVAAGTRFEPVAWAGHRAHAEVVCGTATCLAVVRVAGFAAHVAAGTRFEPVAWAGHRAHAEVVCGTATCLAVVRVARREAQLAPSTLFELGVCAGQSGEPKRTHHRASPLSIRPQRQICIRDTYHSFPKEFVPCQFQYSALQYCTRWK